MGFDHHFWIVGIGHRISDVPIRVSPGAKLVNDEDASRPENNFPYRFQSARQISHLTNSATTRVASFSLDPNTRLPRHLKEQQCWKPHL